MFMPRAAAPGKPPPLPPPLPASAFQPSIPEVSLPPGAVWKGPAHLIPFLVPIERLHADPANANFHTEESYRFIAASYAESGQQKYVVVDERGVVRDGNGQLIAARDHLQWTHLAVAPSDLDDLGLAKYAIAVNQTPKYAGFDQKTLALSIQAIQRSDPRFKAEHVGFSDAELKKVLDLAAKAAAAEVKHDGDGPAGFAGGAGPTGDYVATIALTDGKGDDPDFKSQLARLCNAHGLEFKIKPV